jgi:hypothetical protein
MFSGGSRQHGDPGSAARAALDNPDKANYLALRTSNLHVKAFVLYCRAETATLRRMLSKSGPK